MSQAMIPHTSSVTSESRIRAFRVARAFSKFGREVQLAFLEEKARNKLNRSKIAKKLGINRSQVSRWLKGSENLTLKTMAELAWAMGREFDFSFPEKAPVRKVEAVTVPMLGAPINIHANILLLVTPHHGRSELINSMSPAQILSLSNLQQGTALHGLRLPGPVGALKGSHESGGRELELEQVLV